MTEPSNGPHEDRPTADDETPSSEPPAPDSVELDIDQEKLDAWDDVKSEYQVEPDGQPKKGDEDGDQ